MVKGRGSCSKGCGFKSRDRILDGHFFTYMCCKICNVCLKRPKINKKRPGLVDLKKTIKVCIHWWRHTAWPRGANLYYWTWSSSQFHKPWSSLVRFFTASCTSDWQCYSNNQECCYNSYCCDKGTEDWIEDKWVSCCVSVMLRNHKRASLANKLMKKSHFLPWPYIFSYLVTLITSN